MKTLHIRKFVSYDQNTKILGSFIFLAVGLIVLSLICVVLGLLNPSISLSNSGYTTAALFCLLGSGVIGVFSILVFALSVDSVSLYYSRYYCQAVGINTKSGKPVQRIYEFDKNDKESIREITPNGDELEKFKKLCTEKQSSKKVSDQEKLTFKRLSEYVEGLSEEERSDPFALMFFRDGTIAISDIPIPVIKVFKGLGVARMREIRFNVEQWDKDAKTILAKSVNGMPQIHEGFAISSLALVNEKNIQQLEDSTQNIAVDGIIAADKQIELSMRRMRMRIRHAITRYVDVFRGTSKDVGSINLTWKTKAAIIGLVCGIILLIIKFA